MNDILRVIEERAKRINRPPAFAKESLRFSALMETLARVAREMSVMGGGTGLLDLLLDVAAHAVAWVEFRRPPGQHLESGPTHLIPVKPGNA
jgi:hypothetical protein